MNAPASIRPVTLRIAQLGDAVERARIAAYVEEHRDGTPFHLPAWSAAVASGCGQRAHYLVAERGVHGIVGVLPLTELHSPLFGRVLASAGFGVGGGVLADKPEIAHQLGEACWTLAQRLSCPSVELRGGPRPGPEWTVDDTHYLGFERALAADDAAELLAIPRKQRAEVRKSLEADLTVEVGQGDVAVAAHYAVYAESVRNLGTPVFPARLFREVLNEFGPASDVLVVRHRGQAVAAVLSLYWRGTVYPYWGGGTAAARLLRANDRMYFELMRHARERGCARFDFGRSKVGTGAAAFKKNWGFVPTPLTYYDRVANGASIRDANPLNPRYRLQVALWRRLPLAIANRMGPWIAKGLG
ncbi:FemAB family XrtA/PEP-CTERM system-associated protein [Sphingomonas turrisvirgatae]|uniref:FemAB n=1 Tax=Sphingomonas turrisvirgatae TaxID=1888892 RepID=A0A1E3LSS0_9SPHN|nr:FemAB family XrtA/PEP-CTERM system-associated protein [Sphingomonas turrisvirgatae]ODP36838.1 FemAB [Sphingomonas turrisvirgatae]